VPDVGFLSTGGESLEEEEEISPQRHREHREEKRFSEI